MVVPNRGTAQAPHPGSAPCVLMVHGWGLEAAVWDGVRARLPADTMSLGYRDGAAPIVPGQAVIGVGHSFGALWLLQQHIALAALVIVNGFARFTLAADWPHATAPRVMDRMRRAFAADPRTVLDTFRARCGLPGWSGAFDPARLQHDLDQLVAGDARQALAALRVPVLCLAGAQDRIVSPALALHTAQLAQADCRFTPGGHCLPLTAPDWCAAQIRTFVAAL